MIHGSRGGAQIEGDALVRWEGHGENAPRIRPRADKLVTESEKYEIVRALSYMMALKLWEAGSSDFKKFAQALTISEESFTLAPLT